MIIYIQTKFYIFQYTLWQSPADFVANNINYFMEYRWQIENHILEWLRDNERREYEESTYEYFEKRIWLVKEIMMKWYNSYIENLKWK